MFRVFARIFFQTLGYEFKKLNSIDRIKGIRFSKQSSRGITSHYNAMVENLIHKSGQNFCCIIIGAHNGESSDLYSLLSNKNIKVILIEPNPTIFKELKENYSNNKKAVLLNIAITNSKSELDFYIVNKDAYEPNKKIAFDTISSLDKTHLLKHLKNLNPINESIETINTIKIQGDTLENVMSNENIYQPTVLQVDTEGFDAEIIKQLDILGVKPEILYFEYCHLNDSDLCYCLDWLKSNNYCFVYDSLNILAQQKKE